MKMTQARQRDLGIIFVRPRVMTMILLLLTLSGSASSLDPKPFHRHATSQRCGSQLFSAKVTSLMSCAAICSQEKNCVGFNLEVPGPKTRTCQVSATSSSCVSDSTFNFYLSSTPVATTTTTVQPSTAPSVGATTPAASLAEMTTTKGNTGEVACDATTLGSGVVGVQIADSSKTVTFMYLKDLAFKDGASEYIIQLGGNCHANGVITNGICARGAGFKCMEVASTVTVTNSCHDVEVNNNIALCSDGEFAWGFVKEGSDRIKSLTCCSVIVN